MNNRRQRGTFEDAWSTLVGGGLVIMAFYCFMSPSRTSRGALSVVFIFFRDLIPESYVTEVGVGLLAAAIAWFILFATRRMRRPQ